jgi:outer membrane protein
VGKGFNEQLSINLSVPIWSKGQNASSLQQAKIRQEQSNLNAQQTELSVRRALEQAYLKVIGNAKQYEASQTKLNACKASYDAYGNMFTAGSITAVDLLQQQSTYLNALNEYIQAKYAYLLNRKVINVYMGYNIQ